MAKKRYKVEHEWEDAWVVLEIDTAVLTPELATEVNMFWSNADSRLADADEDVVVAVVKLAGQWFLAQVFNVIDDLNTYGMQQAFDNLPEGWPSNGEHSIRLVDWDGRPSFDLSDATIREVPAHG